MVGLEWPYRGTCHTFPFRIIPHCLSSKKKKKTARGECVRRGFNEGLSTILTCSSVWLWVCVGVRVWERDQGGSVWALARTSICTVCLYRRVNDCVYGKHTVNTRWPTHTWLWYVYTEWVRARLCAYACLCLSVRVCVSVYVHIISLTILLQYFYTSGRTVSCIIVSLNLEKSNVYLIVLFFVAEKTVQKMYNERYQTLIF